MFANEPSTPTLESHMNPLEEKLIALQFALQMGMDS